MHGMVGQWNELLDAARETGGVTGVKGSLEHDPSGTRHAAQLPSSVSHQPPPRVAVFLGSSYP